MPDYPHLSLERLRDPTTRRRHGGGGSSLPPRSGGYGSRLREQVDQAVAIQKQNRSDQFIDPSLVFRVQMSGNALEDEWDKLGMRLLSSDKDYNIVVFSSTDDLSALTNRLDVYDDPVPKGKKNRRYANFVARIDEIRAIDAKDRIGFRFKEIGVENVDDIMNDDMHTVDVELWEFGNRNVRERKVDEIEVAVESQGGKVYDNYIGPSITVLRVRASGKILRTLLDLPEVACIDLPPEVDTVTSDLVKMNLDNAPMPPEKDLGAPVVSILDSGINEHPLIKNVVEEMTAFPDDLGTADVHGHGTQVASVVVFGDLRDQLQGGILKPSARIISMKVLNDLGKFPETQIHSKQIRSAIEKILAKSEYNCRIFVICLGIKMEKNMLGPVGQLAATLDELVREHDIIIFVSAGNRIPRSDVSYHDKFGEWPSAVDTQYATHLEEGVNMYPGYLREENNYILEPAGASNVVTVGALSNGPGLPSEQKENLQMLPITKRDLEPSPFTRKGPGAGGVCKPDFVDTGGTAILDRNVPGLRGAPEIPESGILTLNSNFSEQLLTSSGGTSFSTPMLAKKAAELIRQFPNVSANLIRALLANASSIPDQCDWLLMNWSDGDILDVCGHGVVNLQKAVYSSDNRVVLYADDVIGIGQFVVYHVPIPQIFQSSGNRKIRISLAFDPPVRRTRPGYIGASMNFNLLRGLAVDQIFEHYRLRKAEEGAPPKIEGKYKCKFKPGSRYLRKQTLQTASVAFKNDIHSYGDDYYLVVSCNSGWEKSAEIKQRFSIVVELSHSLDIKLYEEVRRLQQKSRQRIRY